LPYFQSKEHMAETMNALLNRLARAKGISRPATHD
jgi:hypothetical protein